tara:strand:+ start:6456 stop:6941 length:486 start_codon:yes stop_codon:yes gene_type:complete
MARYRKKRRKYLRGGNKPVRTSFDHTEPPTATEAVRKQQAGAANDAEVQMAMNQSGGNKDQDGGELHVPQSGAASPEGNDAMAQSAGMLMQSRQNAPKQRDGPDIKTGGKRRKKTRRRRNKKSKKKRKKKKSKKKRKTKKKYKFARKYHQRGCSRRSCKRR